MCGICGIINLNNDQAQGFKVSHMMKKLKHRGPDDEGTFVHSNVALGFVRLSILDLSSSGHQPMFDDDGRFLIIHNGEVYNYLELRRELESYGYTFHSNTDTEVILKSYLKWGEACLSRFNGMWAFCIFDTHTKNLFISRDRFGIKPLYYYRDDKRLIFASELPPILSILDTKPKPNNQAIFDYLVFNRTDQTEDTFFEGIKKLQHGHKIVIANDGSSEPTIQFEKWYDLKSRVEASSPFVDAAEYKTLFSSAVALRLRSDVPVGVCLSGGLDSSSIVSVLLKDFKKHDLNTFSAVYGAGKTGDESSFIKTYSNSLNNMFFTTPDAHSLFEDLPQFVAAHGEPIPSTAPYAQFKVMELASKNVVVTLDGQGADEQLGGYHYFFGYYYKDLLKQLKLWTLLIEVFKYLSLHKDTYGLKSFAYFMMPSKLKTAARVGEKGYLYKSFAENYSSNNTIAGHLYDSDSLTKSLMDHFEYKLEHLLKWEDRNSMYFSLESRVPFLDYRLVERTLACDSHKIINNGWTKHILREAMRGILPEEIRLRKDKIGFMTPEDEWFREDIFKNFISNILESDSFKSREIIDNKVAKRLYEKHLNKKHQISKEIWKWIHLELWFREFID